MKLLFAIIILFAVSRDLHSQKYWLVQPSPTKHNFSNCVFTDTLKGWICGDSGTIIHTTNKGQSWTFQNSGTDKNIISLFFTNERLGYALAWNDNSIPPNYYGTFIFSTTNGGQNWSSYLHPDTNLFLNTIYFLDSLNGYIAGSAGKIFYTIDGGTNWIPAEVDSTVFIGFPVEKMKFYDYQYGLAVGGALDIAGVMWKTTDGGRYWIKEVVGFEPLRDLFFFDSSNVIGVGGDYEYGPSRIVTTNAGANWRYTEFGLFGIANTVFFRTGFEGWISMTAVDSFLVTTNAGILWETYPTPEGSIIYDLQFIDERNGWAVGGNGVILKYNSELTDITGNNLTIPESVFLYQNFPNPFNPVTKIKFDLPRDARSKTLDVKLVVYNLLGKQIVTLVNQNLLTGSYEVEFNGGLYEQGSSLPSGIYFYNLEINGVIIDTKKMVLIK